MDTSPREAPPGSQTHHPVWAPRAPLGVSPVTAVMLCWVLCNSSSLVLFLVTRHGGVGDRARFAQSVPRACRYPRCGRGGKEGGLGRTRGQSGRSVQTGQDTVKLKTLKTILFRACAASPPGLHQHPRKMEGRPAPASWVRKTVAQALRSTSGAQTRVLNASRKFTVCGQERCLHLQPPLLLETSKLH